jgi:hypothetical protein
MTPDAELLLLIFASHGGSMTKADAEAEFIRVTALPPPEFKAYVAAALRRTRTYAQLRQQVDE